MQIIKVLKFKTISFNLQQGFTGLHSPKNKNQQNFKYPQVKKYPN